MIVVTSRQMSWEPDQMQQCIWQVVSAWLSNAIAATFCPSESSWFKADQELLIAGQNDEQMQMQSRHAFVAALPSFHKSNVCSVRQAIACNRYRPLCG